MSTYLILKYYHDLNTEKQKNRKILYEKHLTFFLSTILKVDKFTLQNRQRAVEAAWKRKSKHSMPRLDLKTSDLNGPSRYKN